jgi:hypothetical protein
MTHGNWCIPVKIDKKGAHVQTPLTGYLGYMPLNPKITKQIIEQFPEDSKVVDKFEVMYTVTKGYARRHPSQFIEV